jgi:hypothetical protein
MSSGGFVPFRLSPSAFDSPQEWLEDGRNMAFRAHLLTPIAVLFPNALFSEEIYNKKHIFVAK